MKLILALYTVLIQTLRVAAIVAALVLMDAAAIVIVMVVVKAIVMVIVGVLQVTDVVSTVEGLAEVAMLVVERISRSSNASGSNINGCSGQNCKGSTTRE